MKHKIFTTAALLSSLAFVTPAQVDAQTAETYQPGPWQPVARINPNRTITVQFINETNMTLEYASTTNEAPPRQLPPGRHSTMNSLSTPTYFVINPVNSSMPLNYRISTNRNNGIVVRVQRINQYIPENTTFNIDDLGGIYAY